MPKIGEQLPAFVLTMESGKTIDSRLGEADTLWKMFGAMSQNRLSIPLYVLVDAQGRLRYAGNGGEDLSDLRVEIKRLIR